MENCGGNGAQKNVPAVFVFYISGPGKAIFFIGDSRNRVGHPPEEGAVGQDQSNE